MKTWLNILINSRQLLRGILATFSPCVLQNVISSMLLQIKSYSDFISLSRCAITSLYYNVLCTSDLFNVYVKQFSYTCKLCFYSKFLWDSLRNSLLAEILFKFMHDSQQLDWCPEVADQRDWYKFSINQLDSEEY